MARRGRFSLSLAFLIAGLLSLVIGSSWLGYEHWQRERFTSYWLTRLAPTDGAFSVEAGPSSTPVVPALTANSQPADGGSAPATATPEPAAMARATGVTPASGDESSPVDISPTDVLHAAVLPAPTRQPPAVRIVIPAIGVDAPVVEVQWETVVDSGGQVPLRWQTADYAAGHHFTSANPGEGSNIVLSGHHNIKGRVFDRLWELKPGDKIWLYNAQGEAFVYVVRRVLIVPEKNAPEDRRKANARFMDPTPDETLTLITCWPPWSNTHRVIVIAKPYRPGTFQDGSRFDLVY